MDVEINKVRTRRVRAVERVARSVNRCSCETMGLERTLVSRSTSRAPCVHAHSLVKTQPTITRYKTIDQSAR